MSKITRGEKEYLEERLKSLLDRSENAMCEIRKGVNHSFCPNSGGFDDLPDFLSYQENERICLEIQSIRSKLGSVEIIEDSELDEVCLGCKFIATANDLNGEIKTETYLLYSGVLLPEYISTEFMPVSINSPFGKAVVSKKINDAFSYVTPDKIVINGVVDEIIKEKETIKEVKNKVLVKQNDN